MFSTIALRSRTATLLLTCRLAFAKRSITSSSAVREEANKPIKNPNPQIRRFWKNVFVQKEEDGYAVLLDKRYLKTPGGKSLRVPLEQSTLAYLIAGEWETQKDALKTHSLPLTSMVCRAQDGLTNPEDREKVVDHLLRYFKTDSICLQEDFPEALVKLQNEHWKPIIDWASKAFGIKISTTTDILGMKQPEESAKVLKDVVLAFTPTELAAFEKAVMSSKSFLIALAIIKRRITSEDAAVAARVEALSQIQYWGELINAHDMDEAEMNKHLAASACLVSKF